MKGHNFDHGCGDICKKCGKIHVLGNRKLSIKKGCKKGVTPCPNCGGYHKDIWDDNKRKEQSKRMKKIMNSPKVKDKLLRVHNTPEAKKRHSNATKHNWTDPNFRKKIHDAAMEQWGNSVSRNKIIEGIRRSKLKRSMSIRRTWSERKEEILKKRWTPEHRKKTSEALKRVWKQPGYREKMSIILKEAHNRPEVLKRNRETTKKQWQNPEYREFMARVLKTIHIPTKPQLRLFGLLGHFFDGLQLEYLVRTKKTTRRIDIAQPDMMLGFEYDEPYWHQDIVSEQERDKELKELGWTIIHFRSLDSLSPNKVEQKVARLL